MEIESGRPKKFPPPATGLGGESSLTLTIQNEKQELVNDGKEKKEMVVMASVKSIEVDQEDESGELVKRNPIELVVVLDRSGSMSGSKLNLCLSTMQFLIDELSSKDSLALVTFDTTVNDVFPLTKMDTSGKQMAHDLLANVRAGSSTNLSGGLFRGIEHLVEGSKRKDMYANAATVPTRAIMLLTDGMANHGVTDMQQLIKISKKMMEDIEGGASASIHCFGYGTDADVAFCTGISEACHGMFYAVNEIDEVSSAFGNCIGGLLAVSAQNIKLVFTPSSRAIEIKEVMTKFEQKKDEATGAITVTIPDMYSEECRDILYKVEIGPLSKDSISEAMQIGTFVISFMDVKYEKLNKIEENCFILRPKTLSSVEADKPNEAVAKQLLRVEGARILADAKRMADAGNLAGAQQTVQGMIGNLQRIGIQENDGDMLGSMMHDLSESSNMFNSEAEYRTKGKSKLASYEATHMFQRSNAVSTMEADSNAYQTKSRAMMARKAFAATSSMAPPQNPKPASTNLPFRSVAAPSTQVAAQSNALPSTAKANTNGGDTLLKRLSNSFKSMTQQKQ